MNTAELQQFAQKIRLNTLKSLVHLGFGHFGGSLSIVETLAVLYGKVMRLKPTGKNAIILCYPKAMRGLLCMPPLP